MAGVSAYLDGQLLTNTVTLSAGLRPAAITNGATAITSTGSTSAQITADLRSLVAAVTSTGGRRTWIMQEGTMGQLALALTDNAHDLPRTLSGYPVIVSNNSPAQITLVDAASILYSDTGALDIDTSGQALLQMDDAPASPETAATVFVSLYQRNLWAVRVIRWLAYLRAQSGSVAYMTVAY